MHECSPSGRSLLSAPRSLLPDPSEPQAKATRMTDQEPSLREQIEEGEALTSAATPHAGEATQSRLPLELLEEVALHLIVQSCPDPPRRPPNITQQEAFEEDHNAVLNVGQLWRAPASHPVRRLSQVNRTLREFVRRRMWGEVYVFDSCSLDAIERLYRYLRCVDGTAVRRWTKEFTYSNHFSNYDEGGVTGNLSELLFVEAMSEEKDNHFKIDARGFEIVQEGDELSQWPPGQSVLSGRATQADVWAMHRFVFQHLRSVERLCWRSEIEPGTMWRGSSLMHVIGELPKLRYFQIDQSFIGGWFYARNLHVLPQVREVWLDCDTTFIEGEPAEYPDFRGAADQPSIDGQPLSMPADHRKRWLTTCNLDKLTTTHFDDFDDPEILAALACIDVVARVPVDGDGHRDHPEDLELGQAVACLRPALLALAAPGKLTAQDVRQAATLPQLARISHLLNSGADEILRRFNMRIPEPESQ